MGHHTRVLSRVAIVVAAVSIVVFATPRVHAQTPPPVPAPYQSLYSELAGSLASFRTTINGEWNGTKHPVDFAAELTSASSSLGRALVEPDHFDGLLLELDSLKAMGVKAINVQIAFPILYPGFYSSGAEYAEYVAFYERVAAEVRARNLKLIARSSMTIAQQGFSTVDVRAFYDGLTLDQYKAGRIATIRTVIQRVRPDYLIVLGEPDTEAAQSRKMDLGTVTGSTAFLTSIMTAVRQENLGGMKVGAGIGSWSAQYLTWADSFLGTSIDFLDVHVYPVNRDFLPRVLDIAELAHSRGKAVAMSEAWLQKVADTELGAASVLALFARDPLSFWAPLDEQFIDLIIRTAHHTQMMFLSPFWSQYFHAYVDYNTVAPLAPTQVLDVAYNATARQISDGRYTSTAAWYAALIAVSPDSQSPTVPPGLSAYGLSSSVTHLTWDAATDNVGVAGYQVFRNNVMVGVTAGRYYQDTKLAASTSYSYTIAAYDMAGNVSPRSAAASASTTSIRDTIPPSTPAGLFGDPLSTSQIELNWMRSTDNVKVLGYKVFRNGTLIAFVEFSSYSDWNLAPATNYTYTVIAVDVDSNSSAASAPVVVRTDALDVTPPTAPTGLAAIPARSIVYLTWTASADDTAVTGYHILRNGIYLAKVSLPYYEDVTAGSAVTRSYVVYATDARGNLSAASNTITITTIDDTPPSVPTGLNGTALSTTQIRVSWTASTDNVKVGGYKVFRNGVHIGSTGLTNYVDSGLAASTTYAYHVAAIDMTANVSANAGPLSVQTKAPDTTPPSQPAFTAGAALSTTQINVAWSAATDNVGVVSYNLFRNGVKIATTAGFGWADSGLSPNTTYMYTLVALDAAGNTSAPSLPRVIATLRPPDTVAPTVPGAPVLVSIASNRIVVSWTAATDNVAVLGYKIYRNGNLIAATAATSYTDLGVFPGLTYTYTVAAYDAVGNTSAQSAGLTVTAPAP